MKFRYNTKSRTLWITTMTLLTTLAMPVRLAAQHQEEQPRYSVKDLGTLGGTLSMANSVNNKGWVDGFSTLKGDLNGHAFLWRNGVMTDLKTLGGPNSTASYPFNERGQVTGYSDTRFKDPNKEDFCSFGTNLRCLPFVWQKGVMKGLPTLGGTNGIATEINNRGQVAGYAENSTHDSTCAAPNPQVLQVEPVIWEEGEIQQLPTFPGDPDGGANGINDRGQAVGLSGTCFSLTIGPSFSHVLLWQGGKATDLGNLGGTSVNSGQDINNQGQVVGYSTLSDNTTVHAFLWTEDDGMQDLGTLPGDVTSFGYGINEDAKVVGTSFDASGNARAFLWQQGVITDLNTLTPVGSPLFLLDAFVINSRGQIVGDALQTSTGQVHAYLATPGCDEDDCEGATPAARAAGNPPKVTLPESVRKLVQQRLGLRSHIPGIVASPRD
jgi:probable HAF family extracellular repeat protein